MRASLSKTDLPTFEPFTLHITIESVDEAKALWCRFNVPEAVIREQTRGSGCEYPKSTGGKSYTNIAWGVLDNYMRKHNLL